MTRSKHSELFCAHCNKTTRMALVGDMQAGTEKVWYRCTRCHHMSLIDLKALASNEERKKGDVSSAVVYSPEESFNVGQSILHTEWNDVGRVMSKTRTSSGGQAIVVSFEKQGQRTLIENLKLEL